MVLLAQPSDLELLGEEDLTDPEAEPLLEAASDLVRGYCGWSISRAAETFVLDGDGGALLFLPTLRLQDVAAVRLDGQPVTDWSWSATGIVERPAGWPRGRRNVQVDALHGHDPVPADVRHVVAEVALRAHLNPAAATSETFAGTATSWQAGFGLTAAERSILNQYTMEARA